MEPWRKNVLVVVFIGYGAFRGWRVYNSFKINQK
jgi:predicted negative regulator of RcsB-dependent stress response